MSVRDSIHLRFQLRLTHQPIPTLKLGALNLWDGKNLIKGYSATSGCIGNQHLQSQSLKGRGPLPACEHVGIEYYKVDTKPINLTNIKGVEGSFYIIRPQAVVIGRVSRGDFGIHFDANAPGSAGCCVLPNDYEWDDFESKMSFFAQAGLSFLPLFVNYLKPPL